MVFLVLSELKDQPIIVFRLTLLVCVCSHFQFYGNKDFSIKRCDLSLEEIVFLFATLINHYGKLAMTMPLPCHARTKGVLEHETFVPTAWAHSNLKLRIEVVTCKVIKKRENNE
jgi:hypothetical protein